MNPITTAPARDEIKKAKVRIQLLLTDFNDSFQDMLAFCEHFILPRDLVKMRNKLKRIQIRLYNVRRLSCMYRFLSNTAYSELDLQKLMLVTYSDVADNYWILMTELRSW